MVADACPFFFAVDPSAQPKVATPHKASRPHPPAGQTGWVPARKRTWESNLMKIARRVNRRLRPQL